MRKEMTFNTLRAARRDRAHQRDAARARPVSRAPAERGRQRRIQRLAHPAVAARGRHAATARGDRAQGRRIWPTRASKGEDFGQLAIANSNSQTALDGGQLGWRKGNQLPQFILDLVTKMKPGEVSEPVRTPSGFHIVKLNERRGGEAQVDHQSDPRAPHPDEAERTGRR